MNESLETPTKVESLRVMLCHEVPLVRSGLRAIVNAESDMAVVGEAWNAEEAVPLLDQLRPEVMVSDLSLDSGGLDTIRRIKNEAPWVRLLIVAHQAGGEFFPLAMRAGADGFLTRDAEPLEIVNAIRCLSKGQNYVNASIVTLLVNTYVCRNRRGELTDPYDVLSEREREVLCLAATGHTNVEIAEILHLSKQTVHNVRARLMEKLGFHDRLELLRYALRRGIVSAESM
jgi:two-component system response regulator NreC